MMLREEVAYGGYTVSDRKRNKGNLGQIIEENFFHYACNSYSRPDFAEAGVELKVTPYREKAHELSEGDTLYLGAAPKGATSNDRSYFGQYWIRYKKKSLHLCCLKMWID